MIIVAGPPGSGKSSLFPVSSFGVAWFNADDRAAERNGGSYINIPRGVRDIVNREFEQFILEHIRARQSFALETTLRSAITFEQSARANLAGFRTEMNYVLLDSFELHLRRVRTRAWRGGHSGPESVLRGIYESSLRNLPRAISEMDHIRVYNNSVWGAMPELILEAKDGVMVSRTRPLPFPVS